MTVYVETSSGNLANSGVSVGGVVGSSVAAASSITITDFVTEITGSGVITTINGLVSGHVYTLIPAAGATWSLGTGGNISEAVESQVGAPILILMHGSVVRPLSDFAGGPLLNVSDFATSGTGTDVDPWVSPSGTGGFNEAFAFGVANRIARFVAPGGYYYITSTINATLNTALHVGDLVAVQGFTIEGHGAIDTVLIGNTGANPVIDLTGRGHVTLRDFGIFVPSGGSNPSKLGIFQARATTGNSLFVQHCVMRSLWIDMGVTAQPTANNNHGSVGIYNYSCETGIYENLQVLADNPVVFTSQNAFALTSQFQTLGTTNSCAQNQIIGGYLYSTGSLSSNASVIFQGATHSSSITNSTLSKASAAASVPLYAVRQLQDSVTPTNQVQKVVISNVQVEQYAGVYVTDAPVWSPKIHASVAQNAGVAIISLSGANAFLRHASEINITPGNSVTIAQLIGDGGVASGGLEACRINVHSPLTLSLANSPVTASTFISNTTGVPTYTFGSTSSGNTFSCLDGVYHQAGSGTAAYKPGGRIASNTTQQGTPASTSPTVLATIPIPANTLKTNNSMLRVRIHLHTGANGNNKTVAVAVAGTNVISFGPSALNAQPIWLDFDIIRTGGALESEAALQVIGTATTAYTPTVALAADTTAIINITVTGTNGTATLNDIVFDFGDVMYFPA